MAAPKRKKSVSKIKIKKIFLMNKNKFKFNKINLQNNINM